MAKRNRISYFIADYAHSDPDLADPIVVRSNLSDDDNRARVKAACPWAVVIQQLNCGYGAFEDADDARRERKRQEKMGILARTKSAAVDMVKRVRINRRHNHE